MHKKTHIANSYYKIKEGILKVLLELESNEDFNKLSYAIQNGTILGAISDLLISFAKNSGMDKDQIVNSFEKSVELWREIDDK